MIKNGRPSPSEYITSRYAPAQALSCVAAIARILPNIGPTQAVHATEKAAPMRNERR